MHLTRNEEAMLTGELGEAQSYAMQVLTRYGEAMQAENMVPITSAHVSYTSLGLISQAGIDWLHELVKKKAHSIVPVTTQTTSMDMNNWRELGIMPERFAKQKEICQIHKTLGNSATFSCSPHLLGHCPLRGNHIVSVESSCIPYMNSVFGARTNRECGQSAILAAIVGRTPNYGLHLDENRKGDLLVHVETDLKSEVDFTILGYFVGKIAGLRIPVYDHLNASQPAHLRTLGAAMATSGGVSMWHSPGISAEARSIDEAFQGDKPEETVSFTREDYQATLEELNTADEDKVEIVDLGCPHYSTYEITSIAEMLDGRKIVPSVIFTIWTSQAALQIAKRTGAYDKIVSAGGHIYTDTCALAIPAFRDKPLATNSAKQAGYAPSVLRGPVHLGSTKQCIKAALTGYWESE